MNTDDPVGYAKAQRARLLPCPFCGGKPYYIVAVNGTNMHHLGCGECGVSFEALWVLYPDPKNNGLTRDIVAAWNKRAEVERLTGCLARANAQAEKFERECYLCGDERDQLRARVAKLEEALKPFAENYNRNREAMEQAAAAVKDDRALNDFRRAHELLQRPDSDSLTHRSEPPT